MQTFSAEIFCHITKELGTLRFKLENAALREVVSPEVLRVLNTNMQRLSGNQSDTEGWLHVIENECRSIGLDVTASMVLELCNHVTRGISFEEECEAMTCIEASLKHEMSTRMFMYLPPDRAKYYAREASFGEQVSSKFQTSSFDIKEAGSCYATGRSTACVFHLMRVMELWVQVFGDKLGVKLVAEKNWQNILDEINKAIKALPPNSPWCNSGFVK